MSGTRLVADAFPYEAVRAALRELAELSPVNFDPMIEVGKRIGWTQEKIDAHEGMRARALCFTFRQNQPPWLRGTLNEDNVFFEYADEKQEAQVRPMILELAARLGLKVVEY